MIVQYATFSKILNPRNIDKSVSDIRIRIRFPFESSLWISLSGCKPEVITEPESTPEGVSDFCRSRNRTRNRIFEWKPDPELEWEFRFLQESD